uniref:Alpha-conotoxin Vt1.23 n=1 Tax=Conus planorbis TaxID=97183 RepID=D9IWN5_CONPO|nr:alpha-conotoxin Vt1.23 precursor [Conus planorbis]
MGMRMMFTVFLLVVLATTVISFTSDRASDDGNSAVDLKARTVIMHNCCTRSFCKRIYPDLCS